MKKLLDIFEGSLSRENPLRQFAWISDPQKPIRGIDTIHGKFTEEGTLRLSFDTGIRTETQAVAQSLINRGSKCDRPCQFGFGAQYAFYHYLNFFASHAKFRFEHDDVFGSGYNLTSDFHIFFPKRSFWLEIKSVPPTYSNCHYYAPMWNTYPDYATVIRCLDEEMQNYEVYGYCTGEDVQKVIPKPAYKNVYHEMPTTRAFFRPYSEFHTKILKLPLLERFDNEHYTQEETEKTEE